jgi:hypothetical protein
MACVVGRPAAGGPEKIVEVEVLYRPDVREALARLFRS